MSARVPTVIARRTSVWAQYTILVDRRDAVAAALKEAGCADRDLLSKTSGAADCLQELSRTPDGLPVSDRLSQRVLSLPMHPYLEHETQDRIIATSSQGYPVIRSRRDNARRGYAVRGRPWKPTTFILAERHNGVRGKKFVLIGGAGLIGSHAVDLVDQAGREGNRHLRQFRSRHA